MQIKLSEINYSIKNNAAGFIDECDAAYYARVREIAEDIRNNAQKRPIVLISGPSGSGKTTTAMTLEKMLDEWGIETHTLSMDNYFFTLTEEEVRLAEEEKFDLESPDRVDAELLSAQLTDIAACKTVNLPKFDFKNHSRVFSGKTLTRKEGEIVILEGIHALNPSVVTLPDDQTTRIYVSVRTRVEFDDDFLLHPEKIRLMRRMIRDTIYRDREITETLKMFNSVQRGENAFIMPYKYRSTYDVDTFIPFEIGLYKSLLLDKTKNISPDERVADIIKTLENVEPLDISLVPQTSLIREFVGNGQFDY